MFLQISKTSNLILRSMAAFDQSEESSSESDAPPNQMPGRRFGQDWLRQRAQRLPSTSDSESSRSVVAAREEEPCGRWRSWSSAAENGWIQRNFAIRLSVSSFSLHRTNHPIGVRRLHSKRLPFTAIPRRSDTRISLVESARLQSQHRNHPKQIGWLY